MSNELTTVDKFCELNKTSLSFKREVSREEWLQVFNALKSVEGCVQFWIGDCLKYREQKWGMYEDIAEETGYTKQALKDIKMTADSVESSRRLDDLGFSHHREVAKLTPEKQELFLEKAVEEKLTVRELRQVIKNDEFSKLKNDVKIDGKYDVIVIDPPWKMEKIEREVAPNQVGFDYPTMDIDKIKEIEIPSSDNCHLFLWTTQKYLPYCFDILQSWGFSYILTFVWHKNGGFQPFNLPQYNCEFALYARKGTPKFIDLKSFPTCFNANRTGHSAKPEEFYEMIRRVTDGRRIDMFNRRKIDGFDTWGNQCQ